MDKCIAPATWTLPSHASLFTGQYPAEHGAHETRTVKCLDIDNIMLKSKTFITDLKEMGYTTYAVTSNPYFSPVYGFDEFDRFIEETYFTDVYGSVVEVSEKIKPRMAKYRSKYGTNVLRISAAVLGEDPGLFFEALATGLVLTPIAVMKKMKAKLIDNWPIEKGGRNMVRVEKRMRLKKPFLFFANFMEPHDPYVGTPSKDLNWSTSFMKKEVDPKLLKLWKRAVPEGVDKGLQVRPRDGRGPDRAVRRRPDDNLPLGPRPVLQRARLRGPRDKALRRVGQGAFRGDDAKGVQGGEVQRLLLARERDATSSSPRCRATRTPWRGSTARS